MAKKSFSSLIDNANNDRNSIFVLLTKADVFHHLSGVRKRSSCCQYTVCEPKITFISLLVFASV